MLACNYAWYYHTCPANLFIAFISGTPFIWYSLYVWLFCALNHAFCTFHYPPYYPYTPCCTHALFFVNLLAYHNFIFFVCSYFCPLFFFFFMCSAFLYNLTHLLCSLTYLCSLALLNPFSASCYCFGYFCLFYAFFIVYVGDCTTCPYTLLLAYIPLINSFHAPVSYFYHISPLLVHCLYAVYTLFNACYLLCYYFYPFLQIFYIFQSLCSLFCYSLFFFLLLGKLSI